VNLLTEKATVEYNSSMTDTDKMIEEIDDAGYDAELQVVLLATIMKCVSRG
jgi:copper chaperone CopZ